jgi:hypothetical protein
VKNRQLSFDVGKTGNSVAIISATLFRSLCVAVLLPLFSASAQSGKMTQAPLPTPTPNTQSTTSQRLDAKPMIAIGAGDDTYKLVFSPGYDGKLSYRVDKEKAEMDRANDSEIGNFIEQLNKVGSRAYKCKSSIYAGTPLCIAKLDEGQYEYASFETHSGMFFTIGGFQKTYAEMSKQGFHLIDFFLVDGSCENIDPDNNPAYGQVCQSTYLFLLEREKGVEAPRRSIAVDSAPTGRGNRDLELTTKIRENFANDLYPTIVFTKTQILLDQVSKNDKSTADNPEVRVVSSSFRSDVTKKINELAAQGYHLALINNEAAVMYKYAETSKPVTYVWLKARDKKFDIKLKNLQESGAHYRMVYRDPHDSGQSLVFEQDGVDGSMQHEYKVLKFDLHYEENKSQKKVYIDLTPSSKETMKMLNGLAKDGFLVKDLFISDKVSVLLERAFNQPR